MLELYENIRKRRLELNMSQQNLAESVGYKGKSMISQIEKGKVDLQRTMIIKFAEALKCSPAYLMGWTEKNEPHLLLDSIAKENNPSEFDEMLVKSYVELKTDNEDERKLLKGFRCASDELKETMLNIAQQALNKDLPSS